MKLPVPLRKENWRCIYCGEKFTSQIALKIHFNQHRDKVEYSTNECCCSCGKYFSEFHYFENHLLQTGHMNDSTFTIKARATSISKASPSELLTVSARLTSQSPDESNDNNTKLLFIYGRVTNFFTGKIFLIKLCLLHFLL